MWFALNFCSGPSGYSANLGTSCTKNATEPSKVGSVSSKRVGAVEVMDAEAGETRAKLFENIIVSAQRANAKLKSFGEEFVQVNLKIEISLCSFCQHSLLAGNSWCREFGSTSSHLD